MVANRELHKLFDTAQLQIESLKGKHFSVLQKDVYLTRGYHQFVENRVAVSQESKIVVEDIRQLYKPRQKLTIGKKFDGGVYLKYPDDYGYAMSLDVMAKGPECDTEDRITASLQKSEKHPAILQDPNHKPSWGWRRAIFVDTSIGIMLYTNNEFTVTTAYLDYYYKPGQIVSPGLVVGLEYKSYDGTVPEKDLSMVLDSANQKYKVVNLAVMQATRDQGSQSDYQLLLSKMQAEETAYL